MRVRVIGRWTATAVAVVLAAGVAVAQGSGAPPGPAVVWNASVRARAESWDWFDPGSAGEYTFAHAIARLGAAKPTGTWQWRVEAAIPMVLGAPDDALLAAPGGQLGQGASYYASNDNQRSLVRLFVKQGFLRYAAKGRSVRVGRFEFADGAERAARDATLQAVKTQRVTQRLIGPFGFSAVGRAVDGVQATADAHGTLLTALAMRPTAGAYRLDGQPGLDISVAYASMARGWRRAHGEADARLFALWYSDGRGTVPTDNRAAAQRNADRSSIDVLTVGGHWAAVRTMGRATMDLLGWGAYQTGSWGALDHAAAAVAAEAGLQHTALPWNAWLRAGLFVSSGDGSPTDGDHETFFQVLPTARAYARMPVYNMMNATETFVTLQAKPSPRVTLRAGHHIVQLTERADLWYLGGGAFDSRGFGFTGRPSNGVGDVATVADLSIGWQPSSHVAVELYAAVARGGAVVHRVYGGSRDARFVFLETTLTR